MSVNKNINLLDELQGLLEKQIELARHDNISGLEAVNSQTECLVEKITQAGTLTCPEFQNRREQLQKLYKQLHLILTANKADTAEKLSRIRKGKKMLAAYSRSLNNSN